MRIRVLPGLKQGLRDCIQWIIIQYVVILCVILLHRGVLYIWSLFSEYGFKELLLSHSIGSHGAYGWDDALLLSIPIYTILFSIWRTFINKKDQWWTIFCPWIFFIGIVYLSVVSRLDGNNKIITIDEYIFTCWLSPLFGALLQGIVFLFKNKA